MICKEIIQEMTLLQDEDQANHLSGFFKTKKGEYGEGDKFLGIKVPVTRSIVKKYKNRITLNDIECLIKSEWHEIRLAGFLLLIELYNKEIKLKNTDTSELLVKFYLDNLSRGNNWDLVDLVSPYILGDWIFKNPGKEKILIGLSDEGSNIWFQRVSIVSTFPLIKAGKFDITFQIAQKFLKHNHDLIHKATGWMLREIGKRGGKTELIKFLELNKSDMPRTMLRYAIEKFSDKERKYFMNK